MLNIYFHWSNLLTGWMRESFDTEYIVMSFAVLVFISVFDPQLSGIFPLLLLKLEDKTKIISEQISNHNIIPVIPISWSHIQR